MKVVGFLPCVMHYHRLASAAISECLAGRTFDASGVSSFHSYTPQTIELYWATRLVATQACYKTVIPEFLHPEIGVDSIWRYSS